MLTDDGSSQTVEAEKAVAWKFLSWSGTIPISLDFVENRKNLSVRKTCFYLLRESIFLFIVTGNINLLLIDAGSIYEKENDVHENF